MVDNGIESLWWLWFGTVCFGPRASGLGFCFVLSLGLGLEMAHIVEHAVDFGKAEVSCGAGCLHCCETDLHDLGFDPGS